MAATRGDDPAVAAAAAARDLATGGAAARRASADYRVSVYNHLPFEDYMVGALNMAAFTTDALPECRVGAHNAGRRRPQALRCRGRELRAGGRARRAVFTASDEKTRVE